MIRHIIPYFIQTFFLFFISTENWSLFSGEKLITNSNILYFEDFEKSTVFNDLHKQLPEKHSFEKVSSPVFQGNFSGKFELLYGDKRATKVGRRAEILFPEIPSFERWYSFAVYFPSEEYKDDQDNEIISQWHNCCGTPTLALKNKNGRLNFRIGYDRGIKTGQWTNYDLGSVPKDSWNEYVFHIIHSSQNNGLVEIWRNGEKILNHSGPNLEINAELPRWKIGIYKSTWDNKPTLVNQRVIYFDNIKLGNEKSNLLEMSSN